MDPTLAACSVHVYIAAFARECVCVRERELFSENRETRTKQENKQAMKIGNKQQTIESIFIVHLSRILNFKGLVSTSLSNFSCVIIGFNILLAFNLINMGNIIIF